MNTKTYKNTQWTTKLMIMIISKFINYHQIMMAIIDTKKKLKNKHRNQILLTIDCETIYHHKTPAVVTET